MSTLLRMLCRSCTTPHATPSRSRVKWSCSTITGSHGGSSVHVSTFFYASPTHLAPTMTHPGENSSSTRKRLGSAMSYDSFSYMRSRMWLR